MYTTSLQSLPVVCAVVPARNEAQLLPNSLRSLLLQDYAGSFNLFLVDDRSTDQTANFAEGVAHAVGKPQQLHIISGESLPNGWSGKLWAVEQGIVGDFGRNASDLSSSTYVCNFRCSLQQLGDRTYRFIRMAVNVLGLLPNDPFL